MDPSKFLGFLLRRGVKAVVVVLAILSFLGLS